MSRHLLLNILLLALLWMDAIFCWDEVFGKETAEIMIIVPQGGAPITLDNVRSDSVAIRWQKVDSWKDVDNYTVEIIVDLAENEDYDCTNSTVTCSGTTCWFDSKDNCDPFPSCTDLSITVYGDGVSSNKSATTAPIAPKNVSLSTSSEEVTCSWNLPDDISCIDTIIVGIRTPASAFDASIGNVSLTYWDHPVTACDVGEITCSVTFLGGTSGESDPATGMTEFTEEEAGSLLSNLEVEPGFDSSSLEVTWTQKLYCDRVVGYQVSWSEGKGLKQILVDTTNCTIRALSPCSKYNVSVVPATNQSTTLAQEINGTGATDQIPGRPAQLTCNPPTSGYELSVSWETPIHSQCVIGYKIFFSGKVIWSGASEAGFVNNLVESLSYTLTDLTPYTDYDVSVAAVTVGKIFSQYSGCRATTLQEGPGAPTSFDAQEIDAKEVHFSWGAPNETNGIMEGYLISWVREKDAEKTEEYHKKEFSAKERSGLIQGLSPDTEYEFMLQGHTQGDKLGDPDTINLTTTSGASSCMCFGVLFGILLSSGLFMIRL